VPAPTERAQVDRVLNRILLGTVDVPHEFVVRLSGVHDDPVVFSLVEHIGGGHDALSGADAFSLVDHYVHVTSRPSSLNAYRISDISELRCTPGLVVGKRRL
jgi:hypothetical protein